MKRPGIVMGVLSGALLTAPLMGMMYLADELTGLPFVPYDLFDWIARVLPGALITFGIDLMIDTLRLLGMSVAGTAKTAERLMAVAQFFFGGVATAGLYFWVARYLGPRPPLWTGVGAGTLVGLALVAVSLGIDGSTAHPVFVVLWLLALFAIWGGSLREAYVRLIPRETGTEPQEERARSVQAMGRRQFLVRLGATTAVITVASSSIGNLLAQAARRELEAEPVASDDGPSQGDVQPSFPNENDPVIPAPGTRAEYTPIKDHYKVFIRIEPTVIDGATWSLPISGLVATPVSLSIDDLRNNYEPRDQFVTISCISGRVGTELIGTTRWTGVSVQDILADIGPSADARYLHITSGDGFYETVDLDLIRSDERIMLCYAWDGNLLPIDHGFPLRIWIPDRYGMKQPKWITAIELTNDDRPGYWVERGWDAVARVMSTSVIDTVAQDSAYTSNGQTFVPVGGIAFAGARGISGVEIRVNGGRWRAADLRGPLSETTWVVWRYDWPFLPGEYTFEVRCVEGDGTPQIEEKRDNRPSGATGIHLKRSKS